MALCRFSDTLYGPDGKPSVGTEVRVRLASFPVGNRNSNEVLVLKTNQSGVFTTDLVQGGTVNIVIRDLGIDITVAVPATPTTSLAALMV